MHNSAVLVESTSWSTPIVLFLYVVERPLAHVLLQLFVSLREVLLTVVAFQEDMPVEYLCNELSIVHANALSRRCEVDQTTAPLHILKRNTKIAFRYHTVDGRVCTAESFQHPTTQLNSPGSSHTAQYDEY